jgi:Ca2+-binding RTX toxin-like protein
MEATNEGTDTVQSSVHFTLSATANVEKLTLTGTGAINGTGNTLNNILTGNSAANLLSGLDGDDTYVVGAGDTVVELANRGTDHVLSSVSFTLGDNVERLTLTGTSAITGTGNSLNNTLTGNSAANALAGGTGNDTYYAGVGDTMVEQVNEGTDLVYSTMSWTLGANLENLTLTGALAINGTGNALNNILTGNSAANVLTGGLGNDTYVLNGGADTVVENLGEGTDTVQSVLSYTLGANLENLTLTGGDPTSPVESNGTGNALNNILTGNATSNGLYGLQGNDTYVVGANDTVVEAANAGFDTVQSSVSFTLGANVEYLTLTGTAAINGTGNALDNILKGNSAANVLTGGLGNDRLLTFGGNDVLNGGIGSDVYVHNGDGQVTIQDADVTVGNADLLHFASIAITPLDLVLSRQVNDLRIAVHGTSDQVTISNWYGGANNQVETIQAGNRQLLNTEVDQLIQAMATFSQQTGLTWDQAIDQQPQQVEAIVAASW